MVHTHLRFEMTKDLTKSQLIPTNRATVYNKYICYLLGMFLLKSHNQHTCYILFVFVVFFFIQKNILILLI